MGTERSPDELLALYVALLQTDSAPIRRVAVWELGRLGDARGAAVLLRAAAEDTDWECRHYAVMALANVGGAEEAEALRELLVGDYLSCDGRCVAGPIPPALAEHLAEDLKASADSCEGLRPRPGEAGDPHGEWWRGGG